MIRAVPRAPLLLGLAGLLPQLFLVVAIYVGGPEWHFIGLAGAFAYAALIFSFLGGLWWGIAAAAKQPPGWIWGAAVAPSLIALVACVPWLLGAAWPGPSLWLLAVAILASMAIDYRLWRAKLTPRWWLALRMPLSSGLGVLTGLAAAAA